MDRADELLRLVREEGMGPLFSEMPRNTLADKGMAGPTAAHRIEEVQTPFNVAFVTFSTGGSGLQNLIGVTFPELPARVRAGNRFFERAGIPDGSRVIFCYPPLIGLFTAQVLRERSVTPVFPERPSRDALLAAVLKERPAAVVGEGTFLAAAIRDAAKLGLLGDLPEGMILVAAGTPLPPQLPEETERLRGAALHDLYGCQEYGLLCLDGVPLRDDLALVRDTRAPHGRERYHLLAGGLPTGDLFETGTHRLDPAGTILTYTAQRTEYEPEVLVTASTAKSRETVVRTAKGILRLKGHVVRAAEDLRCGAERTELLVREAGGACTELLGPVATGLYDEMQTAQSDYQRLQKADPVWNKKSDTVI